MLLLLRRLLTVHLLRISTELVLWLLEASNLRLEAVRLRLETTSAESTRHGHKAPSRRSRLLLLLLLGESSGTAGGSPELVELVVAGEEVAATLRLALGSERL